MQPVNSRPSDSTTGRLLPPRFCARSIPPGKSGSPLPAPAPANRVHSTMTGSGELAAVGSGAPNVMESFRQPQHTEWHGRALAILRPLGAAGKLTLRAETDGLSSGEVTVRIK